MTGPSTYRFLPCDLYVFLTQARIRLDHTAKSELSSSTTHRRRCSTRTGSHEPASTPLYRPSGPSRSMTGVSSSKRQSSVTPRAA